MQKKPTEWKQKKLAMSDPGKTVVSDKYFITMPLGSGMVVDIPRDCCTDYYKEMSLSEKELTEPNILDYEQILGPFVAKETMILNDLTGQNLDLLLSKAIQEAKRKAKTSYDKLVAELETRKTMGYYRRHKEQLEKPAYRVGLFVTALRREFYSFRTWITNMPDVNSYLDTLTRVNQWNDIGILNSAYQSSHDRTMILHYPSNKVWRMNYHKLISLCNQTHRLGETELMDDIELANLEAEDSLNDCLAFRDAANICLARINASNARILKLNTEAEEAIKEIHK